MKDTSILLASREQGSEFGSSTRDLIGRNEYEAGPGIISGSTDLATALGTAADVFAGIAATIAVGAMIWGGIIWSSSAGDEERIAQAKSIIKWAIFGLVLALIAWTIVGTVANMFQSY